MSDVAVRKLELVDLNEMLDNYGIRKRNGPPVFYRHTYRATNFVARWRRRMGLRAMKITNVTEVQGTNEQAEINEEMH